MVKPDIYIYVRFADGTVYEKGWQMPDCYETVLDFEDAIKEHGNIEKQIVRFGGETVC